MAAFYSGENKTLTITLLDSDGVAYDVSAATGIACFIYEQPEKELARYSLITASGYDSLTISGAGNNELVLDISETVSAKVLDRNIYVAGKIMIGGIPIEFKADIETITNHPLRNLIVPE